MKQDPRFRNQCFEAENITDYISKYYNEIRTVLQQISSSKFESAFDLLKKTSENKKRIFIAGNGGSASLADHVTCDLGKGTHSEGSPSIGVFSLTSNSALTTAIANDYGYEEIFSFQLKLYGNKGDLLFLISSSGNSENVINAANIAKQIGISTIGLTGFSGGKLSKLVDFNIHVPFQNYGLIEDCHQIILHGFCQFLAKLRNHVK